MNRQDYDFGLNIRSRALVTLPDSTSQKFLLLGQVPRDHTSPSKVVIVYLDFAPTRKRKCEESDFEKWYARPPGKRSCLMGHKVCLSISSSMNDDADVRTTIPPSDSNGINAERRVRIVTLETSSMILLDMRRTVLARKRITSGTSVTLPLPLV